MIVKRPSYTFCPHSLKESGLFNDSRENCEGKTLKLFFIDQHILRSMDWEDIVSKEVYLKKAEYSMEELEKNNWLIEFGG